MNLKVGNFYIFRDDFVNGSKYQVYEYEGQSEDNKRYRFTGFLSIQLNNDLSYETNVKKGSFAVSYFSINQVELHFIDTNKHQKPLIKAVFEC